MQENKKEYTPKQLEVINANSGYNMVLAGPGCGKTDILAERIARAYEKDEVNLSDMLCLTFTNRAARGMYDRIKSRLGEDATDLFVGNIHRFCSHFLFENSVVSAEASVMDEDDSNEVLTSEIDEDDIKILIGYQEETNKFGNTLVSVDWYTVNTILGIDLHATGSTGKITISTANKIISAARYKVADLQHLIYQVKGEHPSSDWYHKELIETNAFKQFYPFTRDFKDACVSAHYDKGQFTRLNTYEKLFALAAKFQDYKESNGLLDFDDLLIFTYDAFYNDIEKKYHRYNWVQIDEIQDLSNFQIALVDLFTDTSKDFVCLYLGDEQQAIYSFMGASLDTINMLKQRCLSHIYHLDKNFRSPKYLLDLYNEYAIKELGVDRDLLPEPKDNKDAGFLDICLHDYESLEDESDRIYNAVLPYLRNEEHANERTALLVPWNVDANEISDRLKKDNVSHFKISGLDSFQTVHMRTLMAHFNAVDNDFNLIAWSRILKQTYAVETYSEARHLIEQMRDIGMCPSDLLRDNGTSLGEFMYYFDNEEIVVFDTETTGTDVFNNDIIQIAAIKIRNGREIPGSFKEIYLLTDESKIPLKLGKKDNPMVKDYAKAKSERRVVSRERGLLDFMEYVGNDVLLGHNVNFDYNILKNNLKRYCHGRYDNYEAPYLDTLKLAHLVCPKLRKYKLEYLIERLELEGTNSHNAKDDIMATFELAKYCRSKSDTLLIKQGEFYQNQRTLSIIEELNRAYKYCYYLTKNRLYLLRSTEDNYAIVDEMKELSSLLAQICEFHIVDSFDSILSYMSEDVISQEEPNAIKAQFANHLMDMSTYREADLCASSSFKEKLFVSTVHKAKGLEFENVVILRAIEGRYPHFAHKTPEQQEEDKRLFYVGISRAMKRLIVSGTSGNILDPSSKKFTPYLKTIIDRFTVRFIFRDRYLIEIGRNELRITVSGRLVRRYTNLFHFYNSSDIKNQQSLKNHIKYRANSVELLDFTDNMFHKYGVYPS